MAAGGEILESSQRAVLPPKKAVVEITEPQRPLCVRGQGDGPFEIDARRCRDRNQAAVDEPAHRAWCDHPERTGAIGVEHDGAIHGERPGAIAGKLVQPMTSRDPDTAVGRGGDGAHAVVREPFQRQIGFDDALGQAEQPAAPHPNPQVLFPIFEERASRDRNQALVAKALGHGRTSVRWSGYAEETFAQAGHPQGAKLVEQ
jgi:hypothetical protein